MSPTAVVYESPFPDISIPTNYSFAQFLQRYNPENVPDDKVVLEDLDTPHDTLTYGGVRTEAARNAGGMVALGVQPGDAVVIYGANSVAWAKASLAALWLGAVSIGINALVTQHDLPHYLQLAKAKLVFVDPLLRTRLEGAYKSSRLPMPMILDLGGNSTEAFPRCFQSAAPTPAYDLSYADNRTVPAVVLFSSGTSGKPKGVHLSHYNLIAHALGSTAGAPENVMPTNREVFYPPLAHVFGFVGALVPTAFNGVYVLLMRQFEYRKWIVACARIRATMMRGVPAIAVMITKDPDIASGRLKLTSVDVLLCAGATLQTEVVSRLQELLGDISIVQGYGMSEAGVAVLRPARSRDKAGSVGRLLPNMKLRLVDDNFRDVPRNTPGQALVKGPTVFLGYRGNQKATEAEFHAGWLCTGDVLSIDDDGFLWFQDRKKEMIKYKGNQVAPAELEDLLSSHKDVIEAGVCAAWDQDQQTEVSIFDPAA